MPKPSEIEAVIEDALNEHSDSWAPDQARHVLVALLSRWPHIAGPQRIEMAALPDPKAGCVCTMHGQNAGGGYMEYVLEYEPACPEHSVHLYDPRLGVWVHRPDTTNPDEGTR